MVSREASPFTENTSPTHAKASPREFWSSREALSPSRLDVENTPDRSPSPSTMSAKRRASIEKLQSAGRVKSSKIFALESKDAYDPESLPIVERPSANIRPLSEQFVRNSFTRFDTMRKENSPIRGGSPQRPGHKRTESEISVPLFSPSRSAASVPLPASPEKQETSPAPSPTKSSLARTSQFGASPRGSFNPQTGEWSDDEEGAHTPRALHRHNKSVTFHTEPPVINEYEMQTPEPSVSAASDREASWDSDDFYDQDISFDRGSSAEYRGDDSFDEDLENADKTPVVLPEQWSRMSPDNARSDLADEEDDVFDESMESTQRPVLGRSESVASNGSSRPLPKLPGVNDKSPAKRASCNGDELLNMTRLTSLSLQERLNLMHPTTEQNEQQASKDPSQGSGEHGKPEEFHPTDASDAEKTEVQVRVAEAQVEDDSALGELEDLGYQLPRISRESILRKVRNTKYDFEDEDEEGEVSELVNENQNTGRPSIAELAKMDPDQPIPSRENSRETSRGYNQQQDHGYEPSEVEIKEEPFEENEINLSAIPAIDSEFLAEATRSPARMDEYDRQNSVIHHDIRDRSYDDSEGSRYSSVEPELESTVLHNQEQTTEPVDGKETLDEAMQLLTVKDYSEPEPKVEQPQKASSSDHMGLPTYLSTNDYDFGMDKYLTPSPPPVEEKEEAKKLEMDNVPSLQPSAELKEILDLPRPAPAFANEEREASEPGTPSSVIHHRSSDQFDEQEEFEEAPLEEMQEPEPEPEPEEPAIPERRATIKTQGKLKARPSGTPADFEAMAEQRRMISAEHPVPPIPQAYQAEMENADDDSAHSSEGDSSKADSGVDEQSEQSAQPEKRRESRKMNLSLDIPTVGDDDWGLDREFDRVIEDQKVCSPVPFPPPHFARFDATHDAQAPRQQIYVEYVQPSPYSPHARKAGADSYERAQKGYLMRHNTKVVVASNRNVSGDSGNTVKSNETSIPSTNGDGPVRRSSSRTSKGSVRKPSAEQFLKTEPWNGKQRRESQRKASAQRATTGPAPPLPGQESALGVVAEDFALASGNLEDDNPEGVERGRLFVKVVGVKNLDLPMPRNDRIYFKLTLDNGLHCVTTAPIELGRSAPIGQEFELVVHDDLEFQLTLNTKLPPKAAPPPLPAPASPTKTAQHQKQSSLSRFLTSPKKRAERERQQREAEEAEQRRLNQEAARKRASVQPTAWDKLHDLVNAADGSFARSYINLAAHEQRCFGRQLTVDVPCYNEWALEKEPHVVNSVRSKRGTHTGPIRKPPYVVGALELQLLYVPRPKDSADEEMPKSMSSAIREIGRASEVKEVNFEGHLSQQGGDCIHWRRRFFRLVGPRLTAYHEHTHQKRAVINLSKAARLVDDRSTLIADPNATASPRKSGAGGNRRKSAFAEEDEGYQYVEEGFRVRFANGETIDFYADSKALKEEWMAVLAQVVGKADEGKRRKGWTDLVLARERLAAAEAAKNGGEAAQQGTEVRDFTKPAPPPEILVRAPSDRKPVGGGRPGSSGGVPVGKRPGTPPLAPRTGHRRREEVKSMIF